MAQEEVVTTFTAKDAFSGVAKRVQSATQGVAQAAIKGGSAMAGYLGRGAVVAVGGLVGFGTAAVMASAKMDSLKRGLISVAGSTKEANRQMARLKEIARLPGLGFEEAVQLSTNLQSAGLSAGMAENAMMEFGNALALVGRGKDDLNGVAIALTQIASKSTVSAEEILQISERVPQIRKVMQRAFGTSDTEQLAKMGVSPQQFIAGVVAEMQRSIPRATGGVKAAFENLGDSAKSAMAQIGDSINQRLVPIVEKADKKITQLVSSGGLTKLVDMAFKAFDPAKAEQYITAIVGGITRLGPVIENVTGAVSRLVGFFSGLPPILQQAIGMLVVINKFTGGMVTGIAGSIGKAGAGGALGSALQSAILGPIGMIGGVLIFGALALADKVRAGIELLEMKGEMDAAVPVRVKDFDPVTGKPFMRDPTDDEKKAARKRAKQEYLARKFGLDFNEGDAAISGLVSGGVQQQEDSPVFTHIKEQTGYLRQIADNTGEQLHRMALGGSGRTAIDAVTMGGLRRGRTSGKMSLDQAIRFLVAAVHREGQNAVMTNLLTQARR